MTLRCFPVSLAAPPAGSFLLVLHWTAIPARDFLLSVPCLKYTMNFPTIQWSKVPQSNDVWISVLRNESGLFHVYLYLLPCLFIPESVLGGCSCVGYLYILSNSLYLSVVNSLQLGNNSFNYTFSYLNYWCIFCLMGP